MRPHDEQAGERQPGVAQPVPDAERGAVDHAHPGQTEQEARIAGEHGWGYGGEPQDEMPAASTEPTSDETRDEITPPDPDGHHPDWRR